MRKKMMYNTFNMGLGMVIGVDPCRCGADHGGHQRAAGEAPYIVGYTEAGEKGSGPYAENSSAGVRRRHESAGHSWMPLHDGTITDTPDREAVISNNAGAYALERARSQPELKPLYVSPKNYESQGGYLTEALLETVDRIPGRISSCWPDFLVTIPRSI